MERKSLFFRHGLGLVFLLCSPYWWGTGGRSVPIRRPTANQLVSSRCPGGGAPTRDFRRLFAVPKAVWGRRRAKKITRPRGRQLVKANRNSPFPISRPGKNPHRAECVYLPINSLFCANTSFFIWCAGREFPPAEASLFSRIGNLCPPARTAVGSRRGQRSINSSSVARFALPNAIDSCGN